MNEPERVPDDVLRHVVWVSEQECSTPPLEARMAKRLTYLEARLASMEGKTSFCAECERLGRRVEWLEGGLRFIDGASMDPSTAPSVFTIINSRARAALEGGPA